MYYQAQILLPRALPFVLQLVVVDVEGLDWNVVSSLMTSVPHRGFVALRSMLNSLRSAHPWSKAMHCWQRNSPASSGEAAKQRHSGVRSSGQRFAKMLLLVSWIEIAASCIASKHCQRRLGEKGFLAAVYSSRLDLMAHCWCEYVNCLLNEPRSTACCNPWSVELPGFDTPGRPNIPSRCSVSWSPALHLRRQQEPWTR